MIIDGTKVEIGDTITFTYTRTTERDGRTSEPTTRTGTVVNVTNTNKGPRVWVFCDGDAYECGKQYNPDNMTDVTL